MKFSFKLFLLFAIVLSEFSAVEAQNSTSVVWNSLDAQNAFKIEKHGINIVVSAEGLQFTVITRKPETIPQSDGPANWKISGETQNDKYLFGQNGKLTTTTFMTNIGEIHCETWISDNKKLLAFRQSIRRGTGNDAYISVCGGHFGGSFGIANAQRSGSDVLSIWSEWALYKYRQNILRTWMSDLWHVDPDAMMVRRNSKNNAPFDKWGDYDLILGLFTDDEAFTNAINQFVGGNLITFTEKFSSLDEDRKMLYKHVIPSPNASSRPIDLFNPLIPEIMVWYVPVTLTFLVPDREGFKIKQLPLLPGQRQFYLYY